MRQLLTVICCLFVCLAAFFPFLVGPAPGVESGPATTVIYGGLPQAQGFSLRTWTRVLENQGFMLGYSELRRNPLWVAYYAAPIKYRRDYRRPDDFKADSRTLARVSSQDYSRSGYQRGHLAPSWLIAQLYGRSAQRQTFLMSNITPQKANLNQKVWQRLEEVESDRFARWFDGVWVITGPVFDDHVQHLRSGVEIPDAFFRLFIDKDDQGNAWILAFVVPQNVRGNERLDQFLTNVDTVEAQTGFDFFSELDDEAEIRLEAAEADRDYWRLDEVSDLPARY